jgi:hypothetical protein
MRDRTMAHRMLEKKPVKVVAVALANRMARIAWAFAIGLEPVATRWLAQNWLELPGHPGLT